MLHKLAHWVPSGCWITQTPYVVQLVLCFCVSTFRLLFSLFPSLHKLQVCAWVHFIDVFCILCKIYSQVPHFYYYYTRQCCFHFKFWLFITDMGRQLNFTIKLFDLVSYHFAVLAYYAWDALVLFLFLCDGE